MVAWAALFLKVMCLRERPQNSELPYLSTFWALLSGVLASNSILHPLLELG